MAPTFQMGSARRSVVNFSAYARRSPTTPHAYSTRFRLFPFRSPLLRESHSLSFPRGTEMVHFPRLALSRPRWPGCPIRKPPDQRLLTSPRRISLFVASFIASWCQGILRRPLVAWPLYLSRPLHESSMALVHAKSFAVQLSKINLSVRGVPRPIEEKLGNW